MTRYFRVSVLDENEVLEFSNGEDCQRTMLENINSGISEITEEEYSQWKKTGSF
jgi:hypothetical protein